LREITSTPTNDQLETQIEKIATETTSLKKELHMIQGGEIEPIAPEVMDQAEKETEIYQKEWKRRKRGCLEIVDMLGEGMDMGRKELFEKIGLETDEEYGVTVPVAKK
jgi:26S proteasome regulatory subunit (ATPase 3-interacting protein)